MKHIELKNLSNHYTIRKMDSNDLDLMFDFCTRNTEFYQFCNQDVTKESLLHDLTITPPNIPIEQKYFIGFFDQNRLIALMDLIDGYPDHDVVYIGFFMVEHDLHHQGIGSKIIEDTLNACVLYGYQSCRLGIDQNNPAALSFWKKNNFEVIDKVEQSHSVILAAQRKL